MAARPGDAARTSAAETALVRRLRSRRRRGGDRRAHRALGEWQVSDRRYLSEGCMTLTSRPTPSATEVAQPAPHRVLVTPPLINT